MNTKVKEIFVMRAFACSSVVLLHSIGIIQTTFELSSLSGSVFRAVQLLLLYATPMFVFISEFVLSYSYGTMLPAGFFKKRFQYILLPYMFFGFFYALVWAYSYSVTDTRAILEQIILYVFRGDYHGYFVLIIFQFYLLHKFFAKYLDKLPKKAALFVSFLFNIAYLAFFNYTIWADYAHIPYAKYFWTRGYFMIFPAWIFYFILAYYAGQKIEYFYRITDKMKWLLIPLTAGFGAVILYQYKSQLLTVISTKRPDILPYTLVGIMLLFYAASFVRRIPRGIDVINRCSYSIYLIHPFVQQVLQNIFIKTKIFQSPFPAFVIVFVVSLYVPVLITYLINKWSYGYLFVGKLGPSGLEKSSRSRILTEKIAKNILKDIKSDLNSETLINNKLKPLQKNSKGE